MNSPTSTTPQNQNSKSVAKSFSLQSFALGVVSAVAVFGLYGSASSMQTPGAGRYQAVASENRLMILDTITGKAWTKFVSSGSGSTSSGFDGAKN